MTLALRLEFTLGTLALLVAFIVLFLLTWKRGTAVADLEFSSHTIFVREAMIRVHKRTADWTIVTLFTLVIFLDGNLWALDLRHGFTPYKIFHVFYLALPGTAFLVLARIFNGEHWRRTHIYLVRGAILFLFATIITGTPLYLRVAHELWTRTAAQGKLP